jgi:hypothetical protein
MVELKNGTMPGNGTETKRSKLSLLTASPARSLYRLTDTTCSIFPLIIFQSVSLFRLFHVISLHEYPTKGRDIPFEQFIIDYDS